MDLIDADEDDDEYLSIEVVHKVENVPENENDKPEDEEEQAEKHNREYGCGKRIRKQPDSYIPSMEGKSYKTGVNNL